MVYTVSTEKCKNGCNDYQFVFVMDAATDAPDLPTNCAPGSIAYTADFQNVYVFSPSKQWNPVS